MDLIICIQDRFDQAPEAVCTFYKDDFDQELLRAQLQTFGVHFQQLQGRLTEESSSNPTIFDVTTYFLGQMALLSLSQVRRLLQLVLVIPATNATSERSFSALRHVKSYLRSTMVWCFVGSTRSVVADSRRSGCYMCNTHTTFSFSFRENCTCALQLPLQA